MWNSHYFQLAVLNLRARVGEPISHPLPWHTMITLEENLYAGKDLEAMQFARRYHRWIIDEVRPYFGKQIAEVGAGCGNLTEFLLEEPIDSITAFEPSSNMFRLLEERHQAEERVTPINDFFSRDAGGIARDYDSVVYINVMEHIEDDGAEIRRAYDALKPNGHLVIYVPALAWLYSEFDRSIGHFRRYHKRDLVNAVSGAGFEVVQAKYFDSLGIIPWYVSAVLLRRSINSNSVALYDRLAVPVMSRVERYLPPWIGKNLLVVGRKS